MMEIQFVYDSLTKDQQINFFINLIKFNYDLNEAMTATLKDEFGHDELDAFLSPDHQMIIGNDFVEEDDMIVDNYLHLYSSDSNDIAEHIKALMEDGEILTTVKVKTKYKLKHYRCLRSLNFDNPEERPVIPIIYN